MPISLPYPQRSIVPEALAFPSGGLAGGGAAGVSYQQELTERVITHQTTIVADTAAIARSQSELMKQMMHTELRSKCWVGDYQRVASWMIDTDAYVTIGGGAFDPVKFNREIVRSVGCQFTGSMADATGKWTYTCPADAEGIYLVHGFVLYTFTAGAGVTRATMSPFVDGTQWHIMDGIDRGYAGEAPILNCKLNGTALVPLRCGQVLDIRVAMAAGSSGTLTLLYPTSVFGYVNIVRTRCGMDDVDDYRNGASINSPVTGNTYAWV